MPPLTPDECENCRRLAQTVTDLEARISTLLRIREDETFIDAVITVGAISAVTPHVELDTTIPAAQTTVDPRREDGWLLQGAKPKSIISSTPSQKALPERNRGKKALPRDPSPCHLNLSNRYAVLQAEDFPPLPAAAHPAMPPWGAPRSPVPPATRGRLGKRHGAAREPPVCNSEARECIANTTPHHKQTMTPPSTLIIGDSIVRNVKVRGAQTIVSPGATVLDIVNNFSDIENEYPNADRIIIHVGTNDTSKRKSEVLKNDFLLLFSRVKQSNSNVFISGPTPTCGRGMERFSRLIALNNWLSSVCSSHGVGFIDNFNIFWKRRYLFRRDGLHLNSDGSRLLSDNFTFALQQNLLHGSYTMPSLD